MTKRNSNSCVTTYDWPPNENSYLLENLGQRGEMRLENNTYSAVQITNSVSKLTHGETGDGFTGGKAHMLTQMLSLGLY